MKHSINQNPNIAYKYIHVISETYQEYETFGVYLCLSVTSCHCDLAIIIIPIKCYRILGVLLYFVQ